MLLVLGLLLGLGMVTKIYAYMALALCAGMVGLTVWLRPRARTRDGSNAHHGPTRRSFLHGIRAMLWVVVPAVLIRLAAVGAQRQLVRGWDILGMRFHDAVVVGQPTTADWLAENGSIAYSERAMTLTFRSFWGVFGWLSVFMDSRIYTLLLVFTGVVLCGLLWALVRFISGRPETDMDRFQFWILGFFTVCRAGRLRQLCLVQPQICPTPGPLSALGPAAHQRLCGAGLARGDAAAAGQGHRLPARPAGLLDAADLILSAFPGPALVPGHGHPGRAALFATFLAVGRSRCYHHWLTARVAALAATAGPPAGAGGVARVLAWATPFVLLFLLDLVIPFWYIGPQLGP